MSRRSPPRTNPASRRASLVDSPLVGEAWPQVQPGHEPGECGQVALSPLSPVVVRSLQSFTLSFAVGPIGIDDRGAIRVLFRAVGNGAD